MLKDQVEHERARKHSIEQRGLAVVSTSGSIVSLLFALMTFLEQPAKDDVSVCVTVLLVLALALFISAAVLGLFVNRPQGYEEPSREWLTRATQPQAWKAAAEIGARRSGQARLQILLSARKVTEGKAKLLTAAVSTELAAIVSLALSLAIAHLG